MNSFLPFIVAGIATGAILGLAGTGLVLTYKTSGIFNFGYGAIAAASAYVFYFLYVQNNWPWWAAFITVVCIIGPLFGFLLDRVGKEVALQRQSMKIAATIGMILAVYGLATVKYGYNGILLPQYLPDGNGTFQIGGVNISWAQLTITVISIVIVVAFYAFFRKSRIGLAMRAVVDDRDLVRLHGTDSALVQRNAWIIGSTLAALSGVLIAPITGVQAETLTYLVVQAFGAAALGLFSSLPITFVGGILVGVVTSLATKYVVTTQWLAGLPAALPFIILILVLLVVPKAKLKPPTTIERRPPLAWRAPPSASATVTIVVIALLALVPTLVGVDLQYYTVGLTQAMVLLSLGLLVRTAGMISLCQSAFAAVGAAAFAQILEHTSMPWGFAAILGALMVVPVAALLALPAIRLSGLFLALATFGFAITMETLFYPQAFFFTSGSAGLPMPRPTGFQGDTSYYYLVLVIFIAVCAFMVLLHRSRLGRTLQGLAESPMAMDTLGMNINLTRVIVFCVAGFIAGLGGVFYGADVHFAVIGDPYYSSIYSLVLLAMLVVSPGREPWYAVFAGVAAVIPAYIKVANIASWLDVVFGVSAVLVAMNGGPQTMPLVIRRWVERHFPGRRTVTAAPVAMHQPADGAAPSVTAVPVRSKQYRRTHGTELTQAASLSGLEINDLTVRYGGRLAIDALSLRVPMGQITGLIGPNGAGKTSLFNAASGLVRPASGSVLLHGADVSGLSPNARARMGLGRTFQLMQLCDSLTVAQNVALGVEAAYAGSRLRGQLIASRSEAAHVRAAVGSALDLCGISALAGRQTGSLSTGQRRLVEFARCLTGPFDLLMLDEPSSGLDTSETAHFAAILSSVVEQRKCGILLVEHDMGLVLGICRDIYVMDFGRLLFSGAPADVQQSTVVQAAYLGVAEDVTEDVAEELRGS